MKLSFKLARPIKRMALTLGVSLTMMAPAFAAEAQAPAVNNLKLSPWAVQYVNDAQMQGLYPVGVESQRDFTIPATKDELNTLAETATKKLAGYHLKENKNFKAETSDDALTRSDVLIDIYNIVGKYDDTAYTDALDYFKKNELIQGNGDDLALESTVTLEQALTFYNRAVTDAVYDDNMGSKGVFYKTEANGNTVYFLGSIHVGDAGYYPIDDDIMKAFNESDMLYVEADITNPITAEQAAVLLHGDKPLQEALSPELYARVKKLMDSFGAPESSYADMSLAGLYNTLSSLPLVNDPNGAVFGVDNYLLINAKLMEKPIGEVESMDFQMDFLKNFGDDNYTPLIEDLLTQLEQDKGKALADETSAMKQAWVKGDATFFHTMFTSGDTFTEYLLKDRNPNMAKKIDELLKSKDQKTYMVVVGSGHYTSDQSVLDYLKDMGYTIETLTGK
ncbi:TraB/GumN family protein [Peptoniphilus equinus]|uniref:TraB/GumN family protein n=1 Tax=Peptoniphilus equinus TaxID=3016343 RepID=A0ABY7QUS9_9FIRM|nr:TraB/GumN family protein [Peptoniphilus equinus]WBW50538.1 TraB/GumN family protein [Peptoniphilus equinus]